MNFQPVAFNWLHLSDLHWNMDGQEILWPNIKDKFYESLSKIRDRCGPWNAVLFTGDLVQKGAPEQFVELEERFLGPFFEILGKIQTQRPVFLAVPGNHDLNRPKVEAPSAALNSLLNPKHFHSYEKSLFSDQGHEYLQEIEKAFEEYSKWWEAVCKSSGVQINKGILPGDFSVTIQLDGEYNIGIVGLNTAFLQLKPGNYRKKLAWNLVQLNKVCSNCPPDWVEQHDACLLMTHHGPEWLNSHSAGKVYSDINPAGRFAAHLFGHAHETLTITSTSGGGEALRMWQGSSLFGMKTYGESRSKSREYIGYSAGRIEFLNGEAKIRQWPLHGVGSEGNDPNGFRLEPNLKDYVLPDGHGTKPESIKPSRGRTQSLKAPAQESVPADQPEPEIVLLYTASDEKFMSFLADELRCFGWKSLPYVLKGKSTGSDLLEKSKSKARAFCFIISPGFDDNDFCVSKVEQVRRQFPTENRFFILVDVSESKCIQSEDLIITEEGLGGVRRIDIIRIAGEIDELGRNLPYPPAPIKDRREISFFPNPFTGLMSQDDQRIPRHQVVKDLFKIIQSHRVVAISGLPSSGRSALAIDLMANISACEPNRACWPLTVIGTRVCDGSVPDLPRLCSIVFDALGPPPASGEEDIAVALARLLDECETWLVLDQFETAMANDQRCKDPALTRFLRIANNTLEKGRVIITTSAAGVDLGDGQSCVSFTVPEWTSSELRELANHIAETLNVLPPTARHFHKLLALAAGNPFLMVVAMRKWCATGVVPKELHSKLEPYEKLGLFVKSVGDTGRVILHVLDLVTTFSAGLSLIRRTLKHLNRQSIDLGLPAEFDVDAEIANLRRMELVQVRQNKNGEHCYWLPGLVSVCLKKRYSMEPVQRHVIAKVLADCIIKEEEYFESCLDLAGPAIHDGQNWQWLSVTKEDVARAVRAADVLISAGESSYAADLLMGEQKEILKMFNRIAPASIRSNFFSRFRIAAKKDSISYHEATRGLALAHADMADFHSAINLLHDVMDALDDVGGQISQDDLNQYKAKNLDLMAYCQRQIGQLDYSVRTYQKALTLVVSSGYEDERCKLLRGIANSTLAQGDYPQAQKYFDDSKNVAKQLPSLRQFFNEGRINCDRAILEIWTGNIEAAKSICIGGMNAMHECGDLWNERIALMNLIGIELALFVDIESAATRLRALVKEFIHLENFLALRVARNLSEVLKSAPETVRIPQGWTFIELT